MPSPSFKYAQLAVQGQRHPVAAALSKCLAVDVLELTNPAAGVATDLKNATATVASPVTWSATDLKSAGLTKLAAHGARAVTFTTAGATASDAPATATVTGTDIDGNALSETLNLAQTATAVTTAKCYATITSIAMPAADGTDATIAVGIADKFGLTSKAKVRGGGVGVLREVEGGAAPTAGTFATPTASAPYGAYTPNSTPDGSKDFAVWFERDVAA
jgi:flagellar capping protein FliD